MDGRAGATHAVSPATRLGARAPVLLGLADGTRGWVDVVERGSVIMSTSMRRGRHQRRVLTAAHLSGMADVLADAAASVEDTP